MSFLENNLLQIPGEGDLGDGRQLARGDLEPGEGAGGVEEHDNDTEQGGGEAASVWTFL